MGKIKINRKDNFTIISNSILKNPNLTLKAKGLYAYMWSLPDDWDYSVAGLTKVLKEGKDAINEALKELEREGYLVRTILRAGGKFADMDYILHETPQKVPFTENPQAEKSDAENPQQINTNKTKEKKKKSKTIVLESGTPVKSYGDIFKAPEYSQITEALRKFITQCKGMNYTPQIATVKKWADLLVTEGKNSPEYAMRIVNQSIDKGWKALYPLKGYSGEAVSIPSSEDRLAKDAQGNNIVF